MKIITSIILSGLVLAQAATRQVNISWTAPATASGITGYMVGVGPSLAGPFLPIGCTGTVPNQICVVGTNASTTSFVDHQAVGSTYVYAIAAVAAPCTSTTPVTSVCGTTSSPAFGTTNVPLVPGSVTTVTIIVP